MCPVDEQRRGGEHEGRAGDERTRIRTESSDEEALRSAAGTRHDCCREHDGDGEPGRRRLVPGKEILEDVRRDGSSRWQGPRQQQRQAGKCEPGDHSGGDCARGRAQRGPHP